MTHPIAIEQHVREHQEQLIRLAQLSRAARSTAGDIEVRGWRRAVRRSGALGGWRRARRGSVRMDG